MRTVLRAGSLLILALVAVFVGAQPTTEVTTPADSPVSRRATVTPLRRQPVVFQFYLPGDSDALRKLIADRHTAGETP